MAESTTTDPKALTVTEVEALIHKVIGFEHGNEVYPNIFIGDVHFIRNKETLKALGITHVLNAVEGNQGFQVDTTEAYYSDVDISYMGVKAIDWKTFDMAPYFRPAAEFIHTALQDGGKVAVDCFLGCGASFSLVLAYMLLYKSLPIMEAIEAVGGTRKLWPNDGFVQQLIDLDEQLRPTRSNPNMGDVAEPTPTDPLPAASSALTVEEVQEKVRKVNRYDRYNEVYPNVFIGDGTFVRDKGTLKTLGVTQVLNTAEGSKLFQVDTSEAYYTDVGIGYMGVKAPDTKDFSMAPYFRPAADFIHAALQDGGKVAVNCFMGMSRSATLVLAYLMVYKALPLVDAIRTIGAKRQLAPNKGFVEQLIALDNELRATRSNSGQMD